MLVGNWLPVLQNKTALCFHLQGWRVLIYLTCEHGHIPEDENLHQHTSVGLKSHKAVKDQGPAGASSSGMATVRTV